MTLAISVLIGMAVAGATIVLAHGLRPPATPLDRRVQTVLMDPTITAAPSWRDWRDQLVARTPAQLLPDLRLLGRHPDAFVVMRLGWAAGGLGIATVLAVMVGTPLSLLPVAALGDTVTGWYLAVYEVRDAADKRRRTLALALATWTQMSAMLIRSGMGVEQALRTAANAGSHWTFDILASATTTANDRNQPLWRVLDDLGNDTDVLEMRQLAGELRLTESAGGSPTEALFTRAAAMRADEVSETMAAAKKAEVRQAYPLALMAFCLVAFMLYPSLLTFLGN